MDKALGPYAIHPLTSIPTI